jgi:predicted transposase/invertase (TIGR01784 family)
VAGYEAFYDASCKGVLATKEILARIMKDCIKEFRNCKIKDIIEKYIESDPLISKVPLNAYDNVTDAGRIVGMTTEDKSITEGTVTFDIKFLATTPEGEELIIDIEAQNKFNLNYLLEYRGPYYCARMVCGQYGTLFTNSEYGKLRRVVSIWICPYPTKKLRGAIGRTRNLIDFEMQDGTIETMEYNGLMSIVLVCLGKRSDNACLTDLLEVLLSSKVDPEEKIKILEEKYSIPMTVELEEEVINMCNLSEGVKEIGREEGIEIGMELGREEGREENTIASIKKLMKNLKLSLEQAMNTLEIPDADRLYYANALKGK